jgi:CubicO group peptidase (beta-lactamase class C family)
MHRLVIGIQSSEEFEPIGMDFVYRSGRFFEMSARQMIKYGFSQRKIPSGGLVVVLLFLSSCSLREDTIKNTIIVPDEGYAWPSIARDYWPTAGWRTAQPGDYGIDVSKLGRADDFAKNDSLTRCLLVVKDGYIVFEKYYGGGAEDQSSNLWSVTKSFTSALVGILFTRGLITSADQLMTMYLPEYPEFGEIRIRHALTHTSGLSWTEEGLPWVSWIISDDWIAAALARGREYEPGKVFKYSSANSQFLSGLIHAVTGQTPGELAETSLFLPLGIPFNRLTEILHYDNWDEYKVLLDHGWRQDPMGLEIGGFCLYLSARDMAKLGFLFINRGSWDGQQILSQEWVEDSTRDKMTNIYGRYSYGYHWWITLVDGVPCFLASGLGGQIIGIVPSLDLVLVIKYEAEAAVDPVPGTAHDDMRLFELVVQSVIR